MKTSTWLVAACLAASLPAHAQFKPIEIQDQELSELRGRYVMPGRIISFGVVMSSTWQNANGDRIAGTATMHVQQNSFKPQFYVSINSENGSGNNPITPGTGNVSGGGGLNSTGGVTQVVRAAGDNNSAYNNIGITVTESNKAPNSSTPNGQLLSNGGAISGSGAAGTLIVASTGKGIQMNIQASNNQGSSVQQLAQGGLTQMTTLIGGSNAVNNMTQLNVVLRNNLPTAGALNCSLDQLKGLRVTGY